MSDGDRQAGGLIELVDTLCNNVPVWSVTAPPLDDWSAISGAGTYQRLHVNVLTFYAPLAFETQRA